MTYNMKASLNIATFPDLSNLADWLKKELSSIPDHESYLVMKVAEDLDKWVKFPAEGKLLMPNCDRKLKYHTYPLEIKVRAKACGVTLDTRENGPAASSFLLNGGLRPRRKGNMNGWSIHHIYSGKFPFPGKEETTHAVKLGEHFTHSAGLVAIHPIADQMADEYAAFTWYLRSIVFLKFGYDPDGVFKHQSTEKSA